MIRNFTKIILICTALSLTCALSHAQTGLEKIIVEKYYISNADDEAASIGILPAGSVTYRIYLDMKQGYTFQTAYGSPTHTLFINTTTSFFNNEDRGATTPTFSISQVKGNTIMLDSWLTAGAACTGNFGVLKSEDNGVATVLNSDGILKNTDPLAGIPLTEQDGLLAGSTGSFTSIGISDQSTVFDAISQFGNSFLVQNGAWSCLTGASGPDTTNKLLIAQVTTDGHLSFELNVQLGNPDGLSAEQFVAKAATGAETMFPGLTYPSPIDGLNEKHLHDKPNSFISVFPNPTNGNFTVNAKSENANADNQLTIYNLVGKVIVRKNLESTSGNFTAKVDLSSYPNGMYFIEVLIGEKKLTNKLIKK